MKKCPLCGNISQNNVDTCALCHTELEEISDAEYKVIKDRRSKDSQKSNSIKKEPEVQQPPPPKIRVIIRNLKRIGVTAVAFLIAGALYGIWQQISPKVFILTAAVGIALISFIFGTWKWTERFK